MVATQLKASVFPQLLSISGQRQAILTKTYDCSITDELLSDSGGQEVLDFTLPLTAPEASLIKNEMQIVFDGSVFRVRTADEGTDSSNNKTKIVHAEALFYDLGEADAILVPSTSSAVSAINTIVAGTGWVAGSVTAVSGGSFSVTTRATPLACLRALPGTFGGEIWFDNIARTVNLGIRGNQAGQYLYAYRSNLQTSRRHIDTTNLLTRVRPVGANNVDISGANGGITFLDDYSFYDNQGAPRRVRAAVINNDQISDPVALLAWGRSQLASLSVPTVTYIDEPAATLGTTQPGLGDKVRVWDPTLNLSTFARVDKRTRFPLQPWRTTVSINTALYQLTQALGAVATPGSGAGSLTGTLPPAAPASVTLTSGQSVDATGFSYTFANISWPAVTTNFDGSPIVDLNNYEVEYQVDGGQWVPLGRTIRTVVSTPPFHAQASLVARVRAWDTYGNASGWATSSAVATGDTVAPVTPSTPVLSTRLPLAIEVSWNGLNNVGALQPLDFARLEVHLSTTSGFTPSSATLFDSINNPAGGIAVATKLTAATTYFVKTIAVDLTGNKSPASVQASATPSLIPAGSYAALSIVDANIGSMNVGKLVAGTMTADVTLSSRIMTASTGARVEMNSTGIKAYNAGGTNTVAINNDGSASFAGSITSGSTITGASITGGLITGTTYQTAASGSRVTIDAASGDQEVTFWTGDSHEVYPGRVGSGIVGTGTGAQGTIYLYPPTLNSTDTPPSWGCYLELIGRQPAGGTGGIQIGIYGYSKGDILLGARQSSPNQPQITLTGTGTTSLARISADGSGGGNPAFGILSVTHEDFTLAAGTSSTSTLCYLGNSAANGNLYTNTPYGQVMIENGFGGFVQINASVFHVASARKFKRDIQPITGSLDEVMKLTPVDYRIKDVKRPLFPKDDWRAFAGKHRSLVAEDVADVIPHAVGRDEDGNVRGFSMMTILATAIGAIQELAGQVEELKKVKS